MKNYMKSKCAINLVKYFKNSLVRMSIPTINKGGVCAITLHFQPLKRGISAINAIFDNRDNTLAQQIIPYVVVKTAIGRTKALL